MTNFYQQYKSIEPWLQTDEKPAEGQEFLQTVEDRKKLVRCNRGDEYIVNGAQ